MKKNQLVIIGSAIILVVIVSGTFYGGMLYSQSTKKNLPFSQQNQGTSIRGNKPGGAGLNFGEIISKDDKSITIKLTDGGSKIIFYSANTEVGKFVNGTPDDLSVGQTVSVNGSANQDGSITAQSVQIRLTAPVAPKYISYRIIK